ncbi:MAG: NADH-quinone oxidoreductase subunit A [Phycisphaerae bacterium]|nr:NADH-quinone oxidoreductase subunit A [Phycisphaerae bacterium]
MNTQILATVGYAPILVLFVIAAGMAAFIIIASALLGPKRHGPTKHIPYESGVDPTGDARKRFTVRYFLVALLFLLFDVEIVFLWPYAPLLFRAGAGDATLGVTKQFLLAEMVVFLGILLIGYIYAWRKGAFRWN